MTISEGVTVIGGLFTIGTAIVGALLNFIKKDIDAIKQKQSEEKMTKDNDDKETKDRMTRIEVRLSNVEQQTTGLNIKMDVMKEDVHEIKKMWMSQAKSNS